MRSTAVTFGLLASLVPTSFSQSTPATAAPVAAGNPQGTQYTAVLPNNTAVSGAVVVSSAPDGNGVAVQASINNLPTSGGPFCEWRPFLPSLHSALTRAQCTISTSTPSRQTAAAPSSAATSTRTMSRKRSLATTRVRRIAKLATCQANMASYKV